MSLIMIMPTRHRPERALEARQAFTRTTSVQTQMLVATDGDDDEAYSRVLAPRVWLTRMGPHRGMVATLNAAARSVMNEPGVTHIGFMGDDHRPRTPGWDSALMEAAGAYGIAYPNDLNQGESLPTSVVMSVEIVRKLGYVAPPRLAHLYVDDFWRELGIRLGALRYCPDVVIEHMHPTIGKGEWDDQYRRVNSSAQFEADEAAWRKYRDGGELAAAVDRLRCEIGAYPAARTRGRRGDCGRPQIASTEQNGRWV